MNLTKAARRDLAILQSGGTPDLRLGPARQLQAAGLIDADHRLITNPHTPGGWRDQTPTRPATEEPITEAERAELATLTAKWAR